MENKENILARAELDQIWKGISEQGIQDELLRNTNNLMENPEDPENVFPPRVLKCLISVLIGEIALNGVPLRPPLSSDDLDLQGIKKEINDVWSRFDRMKLFYMPYLLLPDDNPAKIPTDIMVTVVD